MTSPKDRVNGIAPQNMGRVFYDNGLAWVPVFRPPKDRERAAHPTGAWKRAPKMDARPLQEEKTVVLARNVTIAR